MKSTKLIIGILAAGMFTACSNNKPSDSDSVKTEEAKEVKETKNPEATYAVNSGGDAIMWEGFMSIGSKAHQGHIDLEDGQFKVKDGKLAGGKFTIDMTSISNEDLPKEGKYNKQKLINHLESPDFFMVDSFPKAHFTITNVMERKDEKSGATHLIEGNLELRGKTKSITFPAKVDMNKNLITFVSTEFVIDRTKWDVSYKSTASAGDIAKDKLIDDSIRLKIKLEAEKA